MAKKTKKPHRIVAGAREALAIVRGKKMPAKVTRFAYMLWSPVFGIFGIPRETKKAASTMRIYKNERVVRVRITTVSD